MANEEPFQLAENSQPQQSSTHSLGEGETNWSNTVMTRQSSFWVAIDCPSETACEELNLTVTDSAGTEYTETGRFHLELTGNLSFGETTVRITRLGNTAQDLVIQQIFFDTYSGEFGDAPSQIPNPGENSSNWPLAELDGCNGVVTCGLIDRTMIDPAAVWLNGSLDSLEDADTFKLNSSSNELIELEVVAVSTDITIEVWNLTDEDLFLMGQWQFMAGSSFVPTRLILEQTNGETWISINNAGGVGLYSLRLANHSQYYELQNTTSDFDLPTHPYFGYSGNMTLSGHIITGDLGDALTIQMGSRSTVTIEWYFSDDAEIQILARDGNWQTIHTLTNRTGSIDFTAPENSDRGGFVITNASGPLIWSVKIIEWGPWDGGWVGDALDQPPNGMADANDMAAFTGASGSISGEIGGDDIRDVYLIEREVGFPYRSLLSATIEGDPGTCTLKLVQLNTTAYSSWSTVSWNLTDMTGQQASTTLDLPHGTHLLIIESRTTTEVGYSVNWAWLTPEGAEPIEEEWVDYSDGMKGFYILIGIILLLPMMVAIYWKFNEDDEIEIEVHEKKRLERLRQRLISADPNDSMDPNALLHALESLADTDWEALTKQWGEPMTRHTTESLDLAIWQLAELDGAKSVTVGLTVGDENWTLAGIRFQAIQGSEWEIIAVTPESMFDGDEVFLGDLKSQSSQFYRIDLAGKAEGFDLILSGLVGGNPVAAVPTKAALLEEE
jgi:hypothetical protein